ncbi:MAG TPA: hypothetical protein VEU52_02370 [Candidatus Limnocylindrales bacterium]|nr:hypothetical protein [Candidatus Limnocylindrales bacterium]
MPRAFAIASLFVLLTLARPEPPSVPAPLDASRSPEYVQPQSLSQSQPPTEEEVRTRAEKVIANQHADDVVLDRSERYERQLERTAGNNPRILEEKDYRVVPNGMGTTKILVKENGKPVDPAEYHKQLLVWEEALELTLHPDDSRSKAALAKYEKKKRERAEMVDGTKDSFILKWLGREMMDGRDCDVLEATPNPKFHPHSIVQDVLTHATAKVWVDHEANQIVRGEARITRDISFGGGILGKLYRGAVFAIDQSEVSPGIWLPFRYQYDFTVRKFLFTSEGHQYIEVSRYRNLGSPKQVLAIVKDELANGKTVLGDP